MELYIQQIFYLAGGVIRCLPALFGTLVWLFIVSPVQVAFASSSPQVVSSYTPVNLTQAGEKTYSLHSAKKNGMHFSMTVIAKTRKI